MALLAKKDSMDGIGGDHENAHFLTHTFFGSLGTLTLKYIYINNFKNAKNWQGSQFKVAKVANFCNGTLKSRILCVETSRAAGAQCFRQIEDRPLDIKSAGQTVSYGEKMGLKYLDVKIYDVLDGLRKCAKILSY